MQAKVLGILLAATAACVALTVYDCDAPGAVLRMVSLLKPGACPDPKRDYATPKKWDVQILQTRQRGWAKVQRCFVTRTTFVTRCGTDSLTYGTHITSWMETVAIEEEACRRAVRTREIDLPNRNAKDGAEKFKLGRRQRQAFSTFTIGWLQEEGWCGHTSFISGGKHFKKSYEQTVYDVTLDTLKAEYDEYTDTIVVEERVRGQFSQGYLHDDLLGTLVWDPKEQNCLDSVSRVYAGLVDLYSYTPDKAEEAAMPAENSIVLLQRPGQRHVGQYAGMVLKARTQKCGATCYNTHIEQIVVCPKAGGGNLESVTWDAQFPMDKIAIHSQIGHAHLTTNMRMYERFAQVQRGLCDLERKVLDNTLTDLRDSDGRYALNNLLGPGHRVTTSGATAYVTRCQPTPATRTDYTNCTNEIPVRVKGDANRIRFADPITYILTEYATVLPCDPIMPPRWLTDDQWYCSTPKGMPCQGPQALKVNQKPFEEEDFASSLGGQLYSADQREQHRQAELIMHSHEAQATAASIQANRHGYQGDSGVWNFGLGLPDEALGHLRDDVLGRVSFIIPLVGSAWPWIAGIGICLGLLQALASCCARIYLVYRAKGFGPWLVPAAISMAFTILIIPLSVLKTVWNSLGTQREELAALQPEDDFGLAWQRRFPRIYPRVPRPDDDASSAGEPAAKRIAANLDRPAAQ